jgi:hypothetical protein
MCSAAASRSTGGNASAPPTAAAARSAGGNAPAPAPVPAPPTAAGRGIEGEDELILLCFLQAIGRFGLARNRYYFIFIKIEFNFIKIY